MFLVVKGMMIIETGVVTEQLNLRVRHTNFSLKIIMVKIPQVLCS
jgi:hypothetical protein